MRLDWGTFNSRIPPPLCLAVSGVGDCSTNDALREKKKPDEYFLIKLIYWWNRRELNPRPKTP